MASRTRRAKVVLGVIAVALVGLGVWAWEPVWMWATTRDSLGWGSASWQEPGKEVQRAVVRLSIWNGKKHGKTRAWYVESGTLASEGDYRNGSPVSVTHWNNDGTVREQRGWRDGVRLPKRTSPPWLWGVTDQTEPTMPEWMQDDEQWQAAFGGRALPFPVQ